MHRLFPLLLLLLLSACISRPNRQEMASAYDDGCRAMDSFDYISAVASFDRTLGLAEELGDLSFAGKANLKIGNIYLGAFLPDLSGPYFEKAWEDLLAAGDSSLAYGALLQRGIALYRGDKIDESRAVLEKVASLWHPGGALESDLNCTLATVRLRQDPPQAADAVRLFERAARMDNINEIEYLSALAYALLATGNNEASERQFAALEQMGASMSDDYLYWKARAAEFEGQYENAFTLLSSAGNVSRHFEEYGKILIQAHRRYLSSEIELTREQARNTRLTAVLWITGLLLLVTALSWTIYRRKKKNEDERARLNLILQSQQDKERAISQQYFKVVGGILEEYVWGRKRGDSEERVAGFLDRFAADVAGGIKQKESFEAVVDRHFDGLMSEFRKELPTLKEEAYRLFCYNAAGFDSTTIALVMDISIEAVYMRRSRLRKRISASNSPKKEAYLKLLGTET